MRAFLATLAFAPLAFSGCGSGGEHVPTAQNFLDVSGTVTAPDGKPLKAGTIHFGVAETGKGRDEIAVVTDGKFTLKMAAAKYKVGFNMKNDEGGGVRSTLPSKYTKYETSNLAAEVKTGMDALKFDLK